MIKCSLAVTSVYLWQRERGGGGVGVGGGGGGAYLGLLLSPALRFNRIDRF